MNTIPKTTPGRGRPRDDAPSGPRPTNAAQPDQYNYMAAPVWNQPLAAPARDGALDHQPFASHGFRC